MDALARFTTQVYDLKFPAETPAERQGIIGVVI